MADPREPSKIVRAEGEVRWCLAAWLEAVGSVDQARQIRYLWHWHADATPHTTGMMITHKQDFRLFGRVVCRDMSVCGSRRREREKEREGGAYKRGECVRVKETREREREREGGTYQRCECVGVKETRERERERRGHIQEM